MDRNSNSRTRIEEIRNRAAKREREFRRKRMMIRRVILLVILAVIVLLISLGVKSCVSGIAEKRAAKEAEKAAQDQASAQTSEPGTLSGVSGGVSSGNPSKSDIDESFYSGSLFFGNSFVDGMEIYELVDGAEYIGRVGLSVSDALDGFSNGDSLIEGIADGSYSKIFMMFGENELGWSSAETFEDKYTALIDAVRDYQPSAQIYLLSITPVSKEVSDAAEDGTTRENIIAFNKMIRSVAQKSNVNFADIFNGLASDGYLPDGAAADGVHFGEDYYIKCLVDIQNAFGRSGTNGSSGTSGSSGNGTNSSDGASGSSGSGTNGSSGTSGSSGNSTSGAGQSNKTNSNENGVKKDNENI